MKDDSVRRVGFMCHTITKISSWKGSSASSKRLTGRLEKNLRVVRFRKGDWEEGKEEVNLSLNVVPDCRREGPGRGKDSVFTKGFI